MPFTLSHPAAAVALRPLQRRAQLPLSAIAIGAMVPDFEFFLYMTTRWHISHDPLGLFVFCLPVGLAVFALWEFILRGPVRDLLGFAAADRAAPARVSWTRAGVAVVGGAASHIIWDGLTHGGRWADAVFPGLGRAALVVGNQPVAWFTVLDHVSTLVGGIVVLTWLHRMLRDGGALPMLARPSWRWLVAAALLVSSLTIGFWNGARLPRLAGFYEVQLYVAHLAIGGMLGMGLGLILYSIVRRRMMRPAAVTSAEGLSSLT